MNESCGVIYILVNPSFPEYVKIGYADDVQRRLKELNRSECIPFAFRLYAYYKVSSRLTDLSLHHLIDGLNPNLRSIDEFEGKKRVREFYNMTAQDAFNILQSIAKINSLEENLVLVKPTKEELEDEEVAEEERRISQCSHRFKDIVFTSSLTGHSYHSFKNDFGTLSIVDLDLDMEIENNAKPSKSQIIRTALLDRGCSDIKGTLYENVHKLERLVEKDRH